MEAVFPILVIVFFVAAVMLAAYYAHLLAQQRRDELQRLAHSLSWQFTSGRDRSHDDEYSHFEIFRRGHSRCAYNTLSGPLEVHGRACQAKMGDFEYKVTTNNGKTTTTHTYRFSYLIIHLPYAELPDLLIRHEGIFDGLKSFFGFPDINFESAEFSKRFYVNCPDKRFAYDIIHPRMMEYLLADDAPMIDMEHCRCCVSDGRRIWSADEFRQHVDWIRGFFDLWPEHVTSILVVK